jgi:thiamine biosynthesis lipoprotein
MGTLFSITVASLGDNGVDALRAGLSEVEACERALSRFDPVSDLSRLNRGAGGWVAVDRRLVEALEAARQARADTDGRFDPTILPALIAAGYDRSFELLIERPPVPTDNWRPGAPILLDLESDRALVEAGREVDLGGIGKGFAADRAVAAMTTSAPTIAGTLVDLGGDIAVMGSPGDGRGWRIDIADPRMPGRVLGTLELGRGGVATSGRDTRRFGPGRHLHHLIDPETGTPAVAGPTAVTTVASTAIDAEAHATALAITDLDEAEDYISARPELGALLVSGAGEPIVVDPFPLLHEPRQRRLVITTRQGQIQWN